MVEIEETFDMYRPTGLCARGCGHAATDVWSLYRGHLPYEFRCRCCVARGKLDRALAQIARIPELEKALHEAEVVCGNEDAKE